MTRRQNRAANGRKQVDMMEQGESMDNIQMTDQFVKEHDEKLRALVADLGLDGIYICIDRTAPTDPEKISKCYAIKKPKRGHAILFNWEYILREADFRFGLLIFAYWLRCIWQNEKGTILLWDGTHEALKETDADAIGYAYDAVQRLFKLYGPDEAVPGLQVIP